MSASSPPGLIHARAIARRIGVRALQAADPAAGAGAWAPPSRHDRGMTGRARRDDQSDGTAQVVHRPRRRRVPRRAATRRSRSATAHDGAGRPRADAARCARRTAPHSVLDCGRGSGNDDVLGAIRASGRRMLRRVDRAASGSNRSDAGPRRDPRRRRLQARLERVAHEEDAPKATDERRGRGETVAAATVRGAVFGGVKAATDRAGATGFSKATGSGRARRSADSQPVAARTLKA